MWRIMTEFKVLPTDPAFQALDRYQLEYIMINMIQDAEDAKMRASGKNPTETYYDEDDSWIDTPIEEWDILAEGHDEEAIFKQLQGIKSEEELAKEAVRLEDNLKDAQAQKRANAQISDADRVIAKNIENAKADAEKYKDKGIVNGQRVKDMDYVGTDISELVNEYEDSGIQDEEDIWI